MSEGMFSDVVAHIFNIFDFCIDEMIILSPLLRDLLFLVWILLGSALALASASHFLVCIKTCEPVVGFLLNLRAYIIGTCQRTR